MNDALALGSDYNSRPIIMLKLEGPERNQSRDHHKYKSVSQGLIGEGRNE